MKDDCIRTWFASGALTRWDFEKENEALTFEQPAGVVIGTRGIGTSIKLALSEYRLLFTFQNWLETPLKEGSLVPVLP